MDDEKCRVSGPILIPAIPAISATGFSLFEFRQLPRAPFPRWPGRAGKKEAPVT
jgi:hypothetical protein